MKNLKLSILMFTLITFASYCGSSGSSGGLGDKLSNIPESDFPTKFLGTPYSDYAQDVEVDTKNNVIMHRNHVRSF